MTVRQVEDEEEPEDFRLRAALAVGLLGGEANFHSLKCNKSLFIMKWESLFENGRGAKMSIEY